MFKTDKKNYKLWNNTFPMESSLEKEVEEKLFRLYSKENMLRLKSKNPFYKKETFSKDVQGFLEYCIKERTEWAKKHKGEEFWEYASYLNKKILHWAKKY